MGLEAMGPDRSLLLPPEPRGGLVLLSRGNVESHLDSFPDFPAAHAALPISSSDPMAFRIFVGNLALEVRDPELRDLFASHGEIADCRVIFSRETGESRGFAFLEFKNENEGQAALRELNDVEFHGRPLRLKEATPAGSEGGGRPRESRPAGPGGGRPPRDDSRGPSRGPAPQGFGGQKEDTRKGSQRKPKDGSEKSRPSPGPAQGRPVEKDRGGSRNRFNYDYEDEDDEGFQLFERDEEDLDYDPEILARLNADLDDEDETLEIPEGDEKRDQD